MEKAYKWSMAVVMIIFFAVLCLGRIASADSPLLYHEPFESLDCLKDDVIESAGFKKRTIESRKLEIVDGRFGNALYLGNPTTPYPFDPTLNKTHAWEVIGKCLYDVIIKLNFSKTWDADGPNWSGPFIWSGDKINPSSGQFFFVGSRKD